MADHTGIEWTDATWNPVVGCTHVSAGCDHCYAARDASGRLRNVPLYKGLAVDGRFTGEVRLVPERLDQPLRWRKPRKIFVNSMSDLFHDSVPDEFIARVFAVMALAEHTFQVLTKRPGRMASLLNNQVWLDLVLLHIVKLDPAWELGMPPWPLPNVWLGTSVEDQRWADIRIPQLLRTPAAVRFLSCEPLLGPVNLWLGRPATQAERQAMREVFPHGLPSNSLNAQIAAEQDRRRASLHWVIVGGESGPGARPMHPDWARRLRDQCQQDGVAFHFKQWGEWAPVTPVYDEPGEDHAPGALVDLYGTRIAAVEPDGNVPVDGDRHDNQPAPGAWWMARIGKKRAGRELDGRTWDEHPTTHREAITA